MTLIEVLVAVFLGALFIVAAVSLIGPALRVNTNAQNAQIVGALSKELSDNVRAWAGGNWNALLALSTSSAETYCLNTGASPFSATNVTETVTVGTSTYQRYFYVSDVYRDSSGNIASTSTGNNYDPSTKQITVIVEPLTAAASTGALQSWMPTTPLPSPLYMVNLSTAAYNGYLYTMGGHDANDNGTTTVNVSRIGQCGSLGFWTATTPLPDVNDENDPAAISNGYAYVLTTGSSTVNYAKINADGTLGAFAGTAKLPVAVDSGPLVASNGYLYDIGGLLFSNGTQTSTVNYAKINSDGTLGSWARTTSLPQPLYQPSALAYNGYLYTIGGAQLIIGTTSTVQFAKINADGTLGSWIATTPELSPHVTDYIPAAAANGYVYFWTDISPDTGAYYAKINSDGTIGNWTSTVSLPSTINNQGGASYNNYLFSVGGSNTGSKPGTSTVLFAAPSVSTSTAGAQSTSFYLTRNGNNALDQTDWSGGAITPGTGAWANTTALAGGSGGALQANSAVINNGYIYSIGGNTGTFATSTVQYASISAGGTLGNWSNTTALPSAIYFHRAVVNNGYIYSIGGKDSGGLQTSTVLYAPINSNGTIGSWSNTTALPSVLNSHSAVVNNGYIYTTGGFGSAATSTVFYAPINSNGTIGSWSNTTALPSAIYSHSAVVNNGYIYTTGGFGSVGTSTVFYAPINSNGTIGSCQIRPPCRVFSIAIPASPTMDIFTRQGVFLPRPPPPSSTPQSTPTAQLVLGQIRPPCQALFITIRLS